MKWKKPYYEQKHLDLDNYKSEYNKKNKINTKIGILGCQMETEVPYYELKTEEDIEFEEDFYEEV